VDTLLNTAGTPYNYRVDLYNTIKDSPTLVGHTTTGSTIFLLIRRAHQKLELRWNVAVPWRNLHYTIQRKNSTGAWDSIGFATNPMFYVDSGLVNGKEYCYRIRSYGSYFSKGLTDPIINLSQEVCSSPRDTIRPGSPVITATANCEERTSIVSWTWPDSSNIRDVMGYRIYFSQSENDQYLLVDSARARDSLSYKDKRLSLQNSLAGCYKITAYDSAGNESLFSNIACVDNCPQYKLPNIFTPNGDDYNDLFGPMPGYRFIQSVNMHIYNRWGQEVFTTTDPLINWDGRDMNSRQPLPASTYYYICDVNEIYLSGIHTRRIVGTVDLMR
jgi:gliding motility-associated-like protein